MEGASSAGVFSPTERKAWQWDEGGESAIYR